MPYERPTLQAQGSSRRTRGKIHESKLDRPSAPKPERRGKARHVHLLRHCVQRLAARARAVEIEETTNQAHIIRVCRGKARTAISLRKILQAIPGIP
jgi:hypothetical protein